MLKMERVKRMRELISNKVSSLPARLKRDKPEPPEPPEPPEAPEPPGSVPKVDLYTAIAPMFYLSRLVGVAPFSLTNISLGKRTFKKSKLAVVYSIIVLLLLIGCFVYVFISRMGMFANPKQVVRAVTDNLEYGFDLLLLVVGVVVILTRGDRLVSFFDVVSTIDTSIDMDASIMYNNTKRFIRIQFFVMFLLFTLPLIFLSLSLKSAKDVGLAWFIYFVPKFINSVFIWQFVDCIALIKQRFKYINDQLNDLISPIYDNELLKNALGKMVVVKPTLNVSSVRYHRNLHDHLCDLTREVNSVYSLSLLFFMAAAFVNLTVELNYSLFPFLNAKPQDMFVFVSSSMMVLIGAHILVPAAVCEVTGSEANQTAVLVHKLLMVTDDISIQDELQMFSLQLLHRKVQFTCCGFFPLDATLLYSIVGGVTTYLVILLQFQSSSASIQNVVINSTVALVPNITTNATALKPKIIVTPPGKPR